MISIFIMYSPDRKQALEATISCLRDMSLFESCQKTLIVDGPVNIALEDWAVIRVPRINGQFCWAYMWEAGVASARFEKILYLDSDRLLPTEYLEQVAPLIEDDVFVFTSNHFMLLKELSIRQCKDLFQSYQRGEMTTEEFLGCAKFEPRFQEPVYGPGKNVMSGSTGFTKRTYYRAGGVDPWYRGHGAFADTDFHLKAKMAGCGFTDLGVPEFHYPHPKRTGDQKLGTMELRRLGLDNFIYYCYKWGLPMALAENIAHECNLRRPASYVDKKLSDIRQSLKDSPGDLRE